jgi:hypothetical protein
VTSVVNMETVAPKKFQSRSVLVFIVVVALVAYFVNSNRKSERVASLSNVITICSDLTKTVSNISSALDSNGSPSFIYSQLLSEYSLLGVHRNYFETAVSTGRFARGDRATVLELIKLTEEIKLISSDNFVSRYVPDAPGNYVYDLTSFYAEWKIPTQCEKLSTSRSELD